MVNGAAIDVTTVMAMERAVLPFTISDMAGDATAAGIAVNNRTPIAHF